MNEWYVLLTVAGGWGWVFSLLFFFLRAFPRRNTFDGREALKWGIPATLSFILWIAGMMVS